MVIWAGLVDRTVGLVDMGRDVDVGWTWAEMSDGQKQGGGVGRNIDVYVE